jgi:hypothetical protein
MLGSMGTKGGTILYHIGYGITLVCLVINGVTDCYHLKWWLTNVGWIRKPNCDWICGTSTPSYIDGVFIAVGGREVLSSFLINHFNLSFAKR